MPIGWIIENLPVVRLVALVEYQYDKDSLETFHVDVGKLFVHLFNNSEEIFIWVSSEMVPKFGLQMNQNKLGEIPSRNRKVPSVKL